MKHSDRGYAIEQRIGVPVADALACINASLLLAQDSDLMCVAVDASGLDQHIGPAHRRVWSMCVRNALAMGSDRDGFSDIYPGASGLSYGELVTHVLESWDDSYYMHNITGAPSQLLHVDTQPSGAITTGSDNTVVTMAMLDLMSSETGITHLSEQVWGDDCFAVVKAPGFTDSSVVDLIRQQEDIALGAGQVVGTVKDSTSGRMVHFLQILYLGGQAVSRRMSYDHETPQIVDRMPGAISEYFDKISKLSSRGGNEVLLNMLQLMTLSLGCYTTVYGRIATMDFDSMVAPNGSLGRVIVGNGLPSSKLYLELYKDSIVERGREAIFVMPKLENPKKIGERVTSAVASSPVSVQIGGEVGEATMSQLVKSASEVLLDRSRIFTIPPSHASSLTALGLDGFSYRNAVTHGGQLDLGNVIRDKRLKMKFKEKALVEQGFINVRAVRRDAQKRNEMPVTYHSGIRIGSYTLRFTMDSGWYVVLPTTSMIHTHDPTSRYRIISPDGNVIALSQRWHPYYCQPFAIRMVLGLTGVHGGRDLLDVKSGITTFSASGFRSDLMPESIMDAIMKLHKQDSRLVPSFLKSMGFNAQEREGILSSISSIPLIRDVSTSSEYSSLNDLLKSAGIDRIQELLSLVCPDVVAYISAEAVRREVFFSHWLGLLYEEINAARAAGKLNGPALVALRLPKISVTA
jgi:hypothetical protein